MLLLPGGRFTMGSADKTTPPNEHPPHAVTVAPFWIDRTEVTVARVPRLRRCSAPAPARRSRARPAPTTSTTPSSPSRASPGRTPTPTAASPASGCRTSRSGSSLRAASTARATRGAATRRAAPSPRRSSGRPPARRAPRGAPRASARTRWARACGVSSISAATSRSGRPTGTPRPYAGTLAAGRGEPHASRRRLALRRRAAPARRAATGAPRSKRARTWGSAARGTADPRVGSHARVSASSTAALSRAPRARSRTSRLVPRRDSNCITYASSSVAHADVVPLAHDRLQARRPEHHRPAGPLRERDVHLRAPRACARCARASPECPSTSSPPVAPRSRQRLREPGTRASRRAAASPARAARGARPGRSDAGIECLSVIALRRRSTRSTLAPPASTTPSAVLIQFAASCPARRDGLPVELERHSLRRCCTLPMSAVEQRHPPRLLPQL